MEKQPRYFSTKKKQVFNMKVLYSLPGEVVSFKATDVGIPGVFSVQLKVICCGNPGAEWCCSGIEVSIYAMVQQVPFLVSTAPTISLSTSKVLAKNPSSESCGKREGDLEVVGSHIQYPVALLYAITCHKSQGLTLPAAVVHYTKEFVPGLIYVSVTHVWKSEHLQVLNFCPNQLLSTSQ